MRNKYGKLRVLLVPVLLLAASCSQLALKQDEINQALYSGNAQKAYTILSQDSSRWEKKRNALLYYWNKGAVAWMLGKTEESSRLFMTSDYFLEDMYRNYADIAVSLFTNDKVKQYSGEDHERILFQYYQILNFMQLGNLEYARVQARRLQLELQRLNDRYKDRKESSIRRFQEDAFAYVLIGLVFEASDDLDNAYVGYKNAVRVYTEDYTKFFDINVPVQLQHDVMRLAAKLGNISDLEMYEKRFGYRYDPAFHQGGNLVFFWNNGLSPVKEEISINFTIVRGTNAGWVTFTNSQYGLSFPVYVGNDNTKDGSAFSQVEFVRATFPKYFIRGAWFQSASLESGAVHRNFELAEDVGKVAYKVLDDRFLEEMGKTLLRLATKKASEYALREKNPEAGAALGVINYLTEQADTRSWESLPHQISYCRMQLDPGIRQVTLYANAKGGVVHQYPFTFDVPDQGLLFHGFHTLQPGTIPR